MVEKTKELSQEAIDWVTGAVLQPHLKEMIAGGTLSSSARFIDEDAALAKFGRIFGKQMRLLQDGRKQTMSPLADAAELSGSQVLELLGSVEEWGALISGLRFRESKRGRIDTDESAFVIKTESASAFGPSVFGAASPAYPKDVRKLLELHGIATGSRRLHDQATDSTAFLFESNPKIDAMLSCAVLPERSQWDHTDSDRYPEAIQEEIQRELMRTAGGLYEINTETILRRRIFEPFFAALRTYARPVRTLPIESGWIACGEEGCLYRFLGGDLGMIRYLEKGGFLPFLDIPRNLVPGQPKGPDMDCTFMLRKGEIPAGWLTWAAKVTFGALPPSRRFSDVFERVDDAIVAMAGADPNEVEYAVATAGVGKKKASKRLGAGLLVRNEDGMLSGWGIPGMKEGDDLTLRRALVQAEQHIARMRPTGPFHATVERLQDAGVQHLGLKVAEHRAGREGLILAADVLRQRALMHV